MMHGSINIRKKRIILGIHPLEGKEELSQLMHFGHVLRTGGWGGWLFPRNYHGKREHRGRDPKEYRKRLEQNKY